MYVGESFSSSIPHKANILSHSFSLGSMKLFFEELGQ